MIRISDITLPVDHPEADLRRRILQILRKGREETVDFTVVRRSVDARRRNQLSLVYTVDVAVEGETDLLATIPASAHAAPAPDTAYTFAAAAPKPLPYRPVVVGAGPCGLFAALLLAQQGFEPLLVERGKPARERAKDVYAFWRDGQLDTESNALFGEGGAGAFSDGKLTTQIKERQNRCAKVLRELVAAGAPEEILYLAKPHIGTDNLIPVVENLRRRIINAGGEVRFNTRVDEICIENKAISGVRFQDGSYFPTRQVVLAIGHSARDTMDALHAAGVPMLPKAFSIGVRVEHPQRQLDRTQYGRYAGHPRLGAAEYKLVHHCSNGRSVYSFCMCPGGEVIATSSEAGQVVTNGMSRYARKAPNANSGLLVGVNPEDFGEAHPLAGIAFQRQWERLAFELGGGDYRAPVQRFEDFLEKRPSTGIGKIKPTYRPGVTPTDLDGCLPPYVIDALREAIPMLGKKLSGFNQPDALMTGVETRSSSPVRIVRSDETYESEGVAGLYPAGEGAGYAGGIISAAVDGLRVAESLMRRMTESNKE